MAEDIKCLVFCWEERKEISQESNGRKRWERRIFKDRNCAQLDLKMGGKRKKFQQTGCRASGHGAVHRRRTYGQRLLGKYERGNYGSWLVRGVHG